MQRLLTPYNSKIEPFAWWENAFSNEKLDWLQQRAKEKKVKAQVGNGACGVVNPDIRRSDISWMANTPETSWVFDALAHIVSSLNAQYFRFDLVGFGEQIQLTNYDSAENGMYGWHVDFGGGFDAPSRKLSVVLQLSDPSEYEGGVLELRPNAEEIVRMRKQRGFITVFPSWTLHQVTPVTQGTRQSLVLWVTGPPFK